MKCVIFFVSFQLCSFSDPVMQTFICAQFWIVTSPLSLTIYCSNCIFSGLLYFFSPPFASRMDYIVQVFCCILAAATTTDRRLIVFLLNFSISTSPLSSFVCLFFMVVSDWHLEHVTMRISPWGFRFGCWGAIMSQSNGNLRPPPPYESFDLTLDQQKLTPNWVVLTTAGTKYTHVDTGKSNNLTIMPTTKYELLNVMGNYIKCQSNRVESKD